MPAFGEAVIAVSQRYVVLGVTSSAAVPEGRKKGRTSKARRITA
jgi:hypothetical protein